MKDRTSLETICSYLPERIWKVLSSVQNTDGLTEIRLRCGRPLSLIYADSCRYLTSDSSLTFSPVNSKCLTVTADDISQTVEVLCRYSRHSCAKELTEGYFVIENGIRVGIAGRRTESCAGIITDISSLNFRFAREVIGCADDIYRNCGSKGLLIAGSVNSGKTTLLRDLCRLSGNTAKTVLVDERNEISATYCGKSSFDVGVQTDVLVGYDRAAGIVSAVRTLSPDVIFCDEIAVQADADAILTALGSGVQFTATIHAGSFDELMSRSIACQLIDAGAFSYIIMLSGRNSEISAIRRLKDAC